jgi:hypothetical protein
MARLRRERVQKGVAIAALVAMAGGLGIVEFKTLNCMMEGMQKSAVAQQEPSTGSADPSHIVKLKIAREYDQIDLIELCPLEDGAKVKTSHIEDCQGQREIKVGEVASLDGMELVGLDDFGIMVITDGEIRSCNYLSYGKNAQIELGGGTLEVCKPTDDAKGLLVTIRPGQPMDK